MTTARLSTPANLKDDEVDTIANFVKAFQDTTAILKDAAELRYTPAPRSYAAKGTGPDPTAEAVMEPGREGLDAAIRRATGLLQSATNNLVEASSILADGLDPYRV